MKRLTLIIGLLLIASPVMAWRATKIEDNTGDELEISEAGNINFSAEYSCITSSTSNTEVKFDGTNSASYLGRVIISTAGAKAGASGGDEQIYLYNAQGSTATANLIGQIDGGLQNTFPYFIKLSSGLTIKNNSGIQATITGE